MCPAGVGRKPEDWQPPEVLRNPWTVRGQLFRCGARRPRVCCAAWCARREVCERGRRPKGRRAGRSAAPGPLFSLLAARRRPRRFATRVWDWGVTPGSIVRCMGPWGPGMASKYCRSRFTRQQQLTEEEVAVFEQVGKGGPAAAALA